MAIQLLTPLLIRVRKDRWDAYPVHGDSYSERDKMLLAEIKNAGGIDQTVPPGFYHFNIIPFNGKDIVTLQPAGFN